MSNQKTKKDFWLEMSIREIWTQSHFAILAYRNIVAGLNTDAVFSSIESFLSHTANVSKILQSKYDKDDKTSVVVNNVLGVATNHVVCSRDLRDKLEHYYNPLKDWINLYGTNINVYDNNIGPKSAINQNNSLLVRHYDKDTKMFTFIDQDYDLGLLEKGVIEINKIADNWVIQNT